MKILLFLMCSLHLLFINVSAQYSHASDTPSIFQKNIISTGLYERDMAIDPVGKELYFTVTLANGSIMQIVSCKIKNGKLSKPAVVNFSGTYNDLEPAFSPDGKRLYFCSNRPVMPHSDKTKDYDIWYVERLGNTWSHPVNAGASINTEKDEFYPSLTKTGKLYFTRENDKGDEDIFFSQQTNSVYTNAVSAGEAINSANGEFNAFVSPDEDFIIFTSLRKGDSGRGDLYISFKDNSGNWKPAKNMGPFFNSRRIDYCPYVSPDKKNLFFTSERINFKFQPQQKMSYMKLHSLNNSPGNGNGDIYIMSWESALKIINNE
jgi:DNA-binding beta-propeller fold protein YncE